ncbi:MAG: STAS domain-containing protein [Planctomycetales bacterium]|nr:STAS domain-containing protein [Planctomycetales bacterium]
MADYHQLTEFWGADLYEHHGWRVCEFKPRMDRQADTIGLADATWQALGATQPMRLVLDMQHVDFMASSLMGALVQLHKRVAMTGGAMHVCGLQEHPAEALHACQLQTIIPLFANVDAAAGFGG